jgi:hypothetical protein
MAEGVEPAKATMGGHMLHSLVNVSVGIAEK